MRRRSSEASPTPPRLRPCALRRVRRPALGLAPRKAVHATRFGRFGRATRDGLSRARLAQTDGRKSMKYPNRTTAAVLAAGAVLTCRPRSSRARRAHKKSR